MYILKKFFSNDSKEDNKSNTTKNKEVAFRQVDMEKLKRSAHENNNDCYDAVEQKLKDKNICSMDKFIDKNIVNDGLNNKIDKLNALESENTCSSEDDFKNGIEYYNKRLYSKAIECWKKACKQNHPGALFNLGLCYEKGIEGEFNTNYAKICYQEAAKLGHAQAQCNLAVLLMEEESKSDDIETAFELFQKSAAQGNITAQCNLAICYYLGKGVVQNQVKAMEFFQNAASKGSNYAEEKIEEIKRLNKLI